MPVGVFSLVVSVFTTLSEFFVFVVIFPGSFCLWRVFLVVCVLTCILTALDLFVFEVVVARRVCHVLFPDVVVIVLVVIFEVLVVVKVFVVLVVVPAHRVDIPLGFVVVRFPVFISVDVLLVLPGV